MHEAVSKPNQQRFLSCNIYPVFCYFTDLNIKEDVQNEFIHILDSFVFKNAFLQPVNAGNVKHFLGQIMSLLTDKYQAVTLDPFCS